MTVNFYQQIARSRPRDAGTPCRAVRSSRRKLRSWVMLFGWIWLLCSFPVVAPAAENAAAAPTRSTTNSATPSARRVFLLGDNPYSAGSVPKILQRFFEAKGQAIQLYEFPLKDKPLLDVAEAARPKDGTPHDAPVVFDHPLRLLVQRSPDRTAADWAVLNAWLPMRYVLAPSPLLSEPLYRERRLAAVAAAEGTPTVFIPLVTALRQAQSQASGQAWEKDLAIERATLLTDYLTACMLYASISGQSPEGLPPDIPLDAKTSLHVPPDAAKMLQAVAESALKLGISGDAAVRDYDPELHPPAQIAAAGTPIAVQNEGLQPLIADWNGDGAPDLIAAGIHSGCAEVFLSRPGGTDRPIAAGVPLEVCRLWSDLQPQGVTVSQIVDWDGNGSDDILLLTNRGEVRLVPSTAGEWSSPRPVARANGEPLRIPYGVSVWAADLDRDGDMELVLGDEGGQVWIAWNDGRQAQEAFQDPQAVTIGGLELTVGHDASVAIADWDCDSRPDLIVGSQSGAVFWCRGLNSEGRPIWAPPLTLVGPCSADSPAGMPQRAGSLLWTPVPGWSPRPAVVDWNGDHWPDLFLGDSNRKIVKYRDLTPDEEAALNDVLARRERLLKEIAGQSDGPTPAQRVALLDLTLAVIEKSRDRRYERCGWLWYFERRPPAATP